MSFPRRMVLLYIHRGFNQTFFSGRDHFPPRHLVQSFPQPSVDQGTFPPFDTLENLRSTLPPGVPYCSQIASVEKRWLKDWLRSNLPNVRLFVPRLQFLHLCGRNWRTLGESLRLTTAPFFLLSSVPSEKEHVLIKPLRGGD